MSSGNLVDQIRAFKKVIPATCDCKHKTSMPGLWLDWWCEACGRHMKVKDRNPARTAVRASLEWAGHDPDLMGLSVGIPRQLSKNYVTKLEKMTGQPVTLLGLSREFQWDCINCGLCCRKKTVGNDKRHTARIGPKDAELIFGDAEKNRLPINEKEEICGFRKEDKCEIHNKRPLFCRMFPLATFGLEKNNKRIRFIFGTATACPGFGKGRVWTVKKFLKESGVLHRMTAHSHVEWSTEE